MRSVYCVLTALAACVAFHPASAEMLPVKSATAPAAHNWSGCYLGAQVGYAAVRDSADETFTGTSTPTAFSPTDTGTPKGLVAGGLIGCNMQWTSQFLVGIEADAEWANVDGGSVDYPFTGTPADSYEARIRFQSSLRARLGYTFDRTLVYITGGVALASIRHSYSTFGLSPEEFSTTRTGWTLGGGIENAFAARWSARIEYRYADFGTVTNQPTVVWSGFTEAHRITEQAVRLGLTYRPF